MAKIEIINEPEFSFGSTDNSRNYLFELDLSGDYRPSSIHGVIIDDVPTAVFGASGGATGVHRNSLLQVDTRAYLAVGPWVVCFDIAQFNYNWALEIDWATCFGVYYYAEALLSHGELEIVRFTNSGKKIWSASGADIFTEGFELRAEFVEAIDFNGRVYHFDYDNGRSLAQPINPADA
jgi:hypothetical protein